MREGAGDQFQQQTKYFPFKMPQWEVQAGSEPDAYKSYPDSPQTELPQPNAGSVMSLDTVLKQRRSTRLFTQSPLKPEAPVLPALGINRHPKDGRGL